MTKNKRGKHSLSISFTHAIIILSLRLSLALAQSILFVFKAGLMGNVLNYQIKSHMYEI